MNHKARRFACSPDLVPVALLFLIALFSENSQAERRSVVVIDTSTSGKLVRVSLGAKQGLALGEPVLFSSASRKIAVGRVIRIQDNDAVVAVLEKYGRESPEPEADYELLYGEPFAEAKNLPDYVSDREDERDNPDNERFGVTERAEWVGPEVDDSYDKYSPEIMVRPITRWPRTYKNHNITFGLNVFRNRALATGLDESGNLFSETAYTTYNGYSFRYAFNFASNIWLKKNVSTLLSAELGIGTYTFSHTFPPGSLVRPNSNDLVSEVRVIPIQIGFRYLVEINRMFRLYPYLGYQYNVVNAVNGSLDGLEPLMGDRILGGAGAMLVMSESIDARVEGGSDGFLGGIVWKF